MFSTAHPVHSRPSMSAVSLLSQTVSLAVLMALAGIVSAFILGQDANWDLQNYHFYNAWAFVNGRMGWDLAPAQLQSFHNPIVELPFYWMVTANWPPRLIAFVMGLPAGVGAFFLGKIVFRLFAGLTRLEQWGYAALAFASGVTASGPVSLLGSSMNEWQGACLIIIALWLVVRDGDAAAVDRRAIAIAGVLCGVASGLKLTAATYAVGLCVALLFQRPVRRGIATAVGFGIAVCAGVLITFGPWMLMLYRRFDNPLFPYFNNVFHSPWWDPFAIVTRTFGPHSLGDWLTFPFRFMKPEASFVSELAFSDWRMPLIYIAIVACGIAWMHRHAGRRRDQPAVATNRAWRIVAIFWFTSFALWATLHSIYRYLIPLELVSGALLIYLLGFAFDRRWLPFAAALFIGLGIVKVQYPDWWRIPFGQSYFEVKAPTLQPGALVMLVDDAPMAYVLPFLAPDARYIGAKNNWTAPGRTHRFEAEIESVVGRHVGPIYALAFPAGSGTDAIAAHHLRRVDGTCAPIMTNMLTSPLELCLLERAAPTP